MTRCPHGIDERIGSCADCAPDEPITYKSFAPKRPPLIPDAVQLAAAGRESEGVATAPGDITATITIRLREGAAPALYCDAPLSRADIAVLADIIDPVAAGKLKPMQWAFDPAAVQGCADAAHERRERAAQRRAEAEAGRAAELGARRAAKPLQCRWCDGGTDQRYRWKTEAPRLKHEAVCRLNPDRWFPETSAEPFTPFQFKTAGRTVTGWGRWEGLTAKQQADARDLAAKWRAKTASLFDIPLIRCR